VNVALHDLLERPENFDSQDVAVEGFLLWHSDEPVLFIGRDSFENLRFDQSIHLENPDNVNLSSGDRKIVDIKGRFRLIDYVDIVGYGGFIRVHSMTYASQVDP